MTSQPGTDRSTSINITSSPPLPPSPSPALLNHLRNSTIPTECRYIPRLTHLLQYSDLVNDPAEYEVLVLQLSRCIVTLVEKRALGQDGVLDTKDLEVQVEV
jgi:hypothetical protein